MHRKNDATGAMTFNVVGGIRRPTYTTDALMLRDGASSVNFKRPSRNSASQHTTPVVSINIVQDTSGSKKSNGSAGDIGTGASSSSSFQIVTLEEAGVVMLWTVLSLRRGDQAGSEKDLGLGIGGRVKLVRSA